MTRLKTVISVLMYTLSMHCKISFSIRDMEIGSVTECHRGLNLSVGAIYHFLIFNYLVCLARYTFSLVIIFHSI